jgi:hypothetical protein
MSLNTGRIQDYPSRRLEETHMDLELVIGVLGAIGTFVGLAVSIYFFQRSRRIRRLGVTCPDPVVLAVAESGVGGDARSKLHIVFDAKSVGTLSVYKFTIQNTGTEPIQRAQIERPITFSFPSPLVVLSGEVIAHSQDVHPIPINADNGEPVLRWTFTSLDVHEYFTIQYLAEGVSEQLPSVSARILGLTSELAITVEDPRISGVAWRTVATSCAIAILLTGILLPGGYNLLAAHKIQELRKDQNALLGQRQALDVELATIAPTGALVTFGNSSALVEVYGHTRQEVEERVARMLEAAAQ